MGIHLDWIGELSQFVIYDCTYNRRFSFQMKGVLKKLTGVSGVH
jgi:hypothetical protein